MQTKRSRPLQLRSSSQVEASCAAAPHLCSRTAPVQPRLCSRGCVAAPTSDAPFKAVVGVGVGGRGQRFGALATEAQSLNQATYGAGRSLLFGRFARGTWVRRGWGGVHMGKRVVTHCVRSLSRGCKTWRELRAATAQQETLQKLGPGRAIPLRVCQRTSDEIRMHACGTPSTAATQRAVVVRHCVLRSGSCAI